MKIRKNEKSEEVATETKTKRKNPEKKNEKTFPTRPRPHSPSVTCGMTA